MASKTRQSLKQSAAQAEEYRGYAAECDERAAASRDPDVKDRFLALARRWREMAKQIEQKLR
jgi:hypothetical protein